MESRWSRSLANGRAAVRPRAEVISGALGAGVGAGLPFLVTDNPGAGWLVAGAIAGALVGFASPPAFAFVGTFLTHGRHLVLERLAAIEALVAAPEAPLASANRKEALRLLHDRAGLPSPAPVLKSGASAWARELRTFAIQGRMLSERLPRLTDIHHRTSDGAQRELNHWTQAVCDRMTENRVDPFMVRQFVAAPAPSGAFNREQEQLLHRLKMLDRIIEHVAG